MARQKKVVNLEPITKVEAESAFADYAKADAKSNVITSKLDVEITKLREKQQAELAELKAAKDLAFEKLENYANNNKDEFAKKKSMEFTHGVLGFRTGTPEINKTKEYTWEGILKNIKKYMPTYFRSVDAISKDKLLTDRAKPEMAALFLKVGIFVNQKESFFVEPKKELEAA